MLARSLPEYREKEIRVQKEVEETCWFTMFLGHVCSKQHTAKTQIKFCSIKTRINIGFLCMYVCI